ncbi:MAG TPA: cation:proton antiporter, partial [Solirubrobacteraceae bacterium]
MRRLSDAPLVIVITVLTAYGAYIGAEELHASGILAAVVAGVYTGWQAPRSNDADTRLTGVAFWAVLVFALEITLFVLLGLQLPVVVDQLRSSASSVGELLPAAAAIAAVTLVVRMAFVFGLRDETGDTAAERLVVGWSGMRGAVSLAAALAVPLTVAGRPQIVALTFSLILFTLVGQGLTLPLLLRAVDIPEQRRWSDEEATARMEAAQAALDRIDELEDEELLAEQQLNRLRDVYRLRFRACIAVLGGEDASAQAHVQRVADYGKRRRELIGVERETVADLHSSGKLSNVVLRQIQRDLDLEEARLRA